MDDANYLLSLEKKVIEAKHVIAFGTGRHSRHFIHLPESVLDKIIFFVDNDIAKQGKTIQIGKHEYYIKPMDAVLQFPLRDILFIVGILNYKEVMQSLKEPYAGMDYIGLRQFTDLILDERALKLEIPDWDIIGEQIIPKKIHYCWFGGTEIPDEHKRYIEGWSKKCPDYSINLWNEKNYDYTKNQYMKQAYESKKWGFVPDYARLDIIYNEGGIYLDTDVELMDNFDNLLGNEAFVGFESENHVNLGQGFGGRAGNFMIKELRDYYNSISFVLEDGSLNLIPSPHHQTEVLKKYGLITNGEYQELDGIVIYPEKVLCPMSLRTNRLTANQYTKAIHHFAGSWLPDSKRIRQMSEE